MQSGVAVVNTDLSRAVHGVKGCTSMPDDFGNITLRAAIDAQKINLLNLGIHSGNISNSIELMYVDLLWSDLVLSGKNLTRYSAKLFTVDASPEYCTDACGASASCMSHLALPNA